VTAVSPEDGLASRVARCTSWPHVTLAAGLLGLAGALLVANLIRFHGYTMDDAFMTYRYAEHLATGRGLVFNAGETPRSEGITSPLWAGLLAIGHLLGADARLLSKVLGVLCAVLTCLLIHGAVRTLCRRHLDPAGGLGWVFGALAVLIYASDPFVSGNAISGMETAAGTLAFSGFLFLIVSRLEGAGSRDAAVIGVSAVAVCLLRPELGLGVVVALALAAWLGRGRRRVFWGAAGIFAGLGLAFWLWRFLYFGLPLPLPFYVKQLGHGLVPGLPIVARWWLRYGIAYPVLAVLLLWLAGSRSARGPLLLGVVTVVQSGYFVLVRPEMAFGYRYLQPLVPVVLVLLALGLAVLFTFLRRCGAAIRSPVAALLVVVCALPLLALNARSLTEARLVYLRSYWNGPMRRIIAIGRALREADASGERSMALNDCGAIPYYSGWTAIDLSGLNDRAIALRPTPEGVLAEVSRRRPDVMILGSMDAQQYRPLFPGEVLLHERAAEIGYEYLGTVTLGDGYHYWWYAVTNRSIESLGPMLRTRFGLYVAQGEQRDAPAPGPKARSSPSNGSG
jgi:hypothetical protein